MAPTASRPVAPSTKKKKAKTAMPGAKSGWPSRMVDQMRDYAVIGIMLAGVAMYGQYLQAQAEAHGHGHGGEEHGDGHGEEAHHEPEHHEEEHHEEEHHRLLTQLGRMLSGHHVDPALDMQVTLGICVLLISITIFFEVVKHHLEHTVPPMMSKILQAMFGELTVLGFIALCTYFMIKLGLIEFASMVIYHDPEHLLHLFEDIHFMLFFVMIIFLIEAGILIAATLNAERYFMRFEALLANAPALEKANPADAAAAPAVAQLLATYKLARQHCCTRLCLCPRLLWSYREAEAKEELTYALLRARFIYPPNPKPGTPPLPSDFDFSAYLRRRMMHEVAHSLHVSPNTWAAIIFLLGGILYLPVLEKQELGYDVVSVYSVIGLCWGLWLYSFALKAKLGHVMYMLTPPHALLDGAPKAFDEEVSDDHCHCMHAARLTDCVPHCMCVCTRCSSSSRARRWRCWPRARTRRRTRLSSRLRTARSTSGSSGAAARAQAICSSCCDSRCSPRLSASPCATHGSRPAPRTLRFCCLPSCPSST